MEGSAVESGGEEAVKSVSRESSDLVELIFVAPPRSTLERAWSKGRNDQRFASWYQTRQRIAYLLEFSHFRLIGEIDQRLPSPL
ncbi:hypothetical protein IMCC1923_33570 [Rhodobacteraceae bacterium IMCC1923]|nr:hypothetical protein [Rhodobacteraceae bacterium IMCC1923]